MTKQPVHLQRLESRVDPHRRPARRARGAHRRLTAAELATRGCPGMRCATSPDADRAGRRVRLRRDRRVVRRQREAFAEDLQAIDRSPINVRINSPGGSVFDAIAIYNALNHHPARSVTYVDGLAASAASVIAMAGDEIVMMPGSQMMIHDASAVHDGNAADMAKMGTFLDRQSNNIADLYRMRAGGDIAEWRDLMLAETWMFAPKPSTPASPTASQEAPGPADPELVDKMARTFDLGQYRYAGRRAAPGPAQRRAARTGRSVARSSSDADYRAAARLRTGTVPRPPPPDRPGRVSARVAAFPAQLRAELVDHNGQQRYYLSDTPSVVNTPYEMWDCVRAVHGGHRRRTRSPAPSPPVPTSRSSPTTAASPWHAPRTTRCGCAWTASAWPSRRG
jgi:hypothetical protein